MIVDIQVTIQGSRQAIWAAITDIEHAAEILGGVEAIEIVERPASGLVGLRWRETRMLFGKPATVEKRITDAVENEWYSTRAEDGGFVFLSTLRIGEGAGGRTLTSVHETRAQTILSRLSSIPMVLFFKGVARRALLADLNDVKAAVERRG